MYKEVYWTLPIPCMVVTLEIKKNSEHYMLFSVVLNYFVLYVN
jgi:hypothetical protein